MLNMSNLCQAFKSPASCNKPLQGQIGEAITPHPGEAAQGMNLVVQSSALAHAKLSREQTSAIDTLPLVGKQPL